MSNDVVIKAEDISKLYRLGQVGTGTLSHDLKRWWALARGKEDPYLKIGAENDRTKKSQSDYAWALKDINFEINRGDTIGIIGKNGAGKSTLLKLLSRVTTPTTGQIKIKGRIAALLEVGTGFHPELTGRENIFMNGAILGMTKKEIERKFDEIVDFAGVEMYIDTPVKRYSSGMYVRLAFGVAAHLEPEILIVDEVLAVGDAEFQKKCLGKMSDVASHGRTIIFVSHNMQAIQSLCKKAIFLYNGRVHSQGPVEATINDYLKKSSTSSYVSFEGDLKYSNELIELRSIKVINEHEVGGNFSIDKDVRVEVEAINKNVQTEINVNLFFNTLDGACVFATCSEPQIIKPGHFTASCHIPAHYLNDMVYSLNIMVVNRGAHIMLAKDVISIEVIEPPRPVGCLGKFPGLVRPKFNWDIK